MENLTSTKLKAFVETFDAVLEEALNKATLRHVREKGNKDNSAPAFCDLEDTTENSLQFRSENNYGYSKSFHLTFDEILMDDETYLEQVDADIQRKNEKIAELKARKKEKVEEQEKELLKKLEAKYRNKTSTEI